MMRGSHVDHWWWEIIAWVIVTVADGLFALEDAIVSVRTRLS